MRETPFSTMTVRRCIHTKGIDIYDKKLTIRAVQLVMSDITNKYCDPTSERCSGELTDLLKDQERAEELLQALSREDADAFEGNEQGNSKR